MELSILYEDESFVVINKDSGISAIPGRGEDPSLSLLQIAEGKLSQKLFVVHRIDKDTSGVIIFAKDAASHRYMNTLFEKRLVEKQYKAVVLGVPQKDDTIDAPIFEFGSGRMGVSERGKPSQTKYHVEEKMNNSALLDVHPFTGRRHQIRVHLYSIGFPILGDRMYGSPRPVGCVERLMLHACRISFMHPDKTVRTITAPFSEQWNLICENLKLSLDSE